MKKTITKAVIPAAGLGTRFLPATKAIPKEMLPIVDTPTIQLIIEEAAESGIQTAIMVSSRGKVAVEDHFDFHESLENKLALGNKTELLDRLRRTNDIVKVVSIRQGIPKGLGHAIYCAKDLIGDEPFAVLLGDDIIDHDTPCTKAMIEIYNKYQKSVVALMPLPQSEISKFGIAAGKKISDTLIDIQQLVEKPSPEEAPSNLAIVGRYILSPRIFDILENQKPGKGGEIQLTDAMRTLMEEEGFIGYLFPGERFDAGDALGFVQANIAYALKRTELAAPLREFMKKLC